MSLPTTFTVNGDVYTRTTNSPENGRLVYLGPDHHDTKRQFLEFISTAPKRNGKQFGVRRLLIRHTQDVDVIDADDATGLAPVVSYISLNWPVGINGSDSADLPLMCSVVPHIVNPTDDDFNIAIDNLALFTAVTKGVM